MTPLPAAPTPRVLWVELTSKCPFDCVFCSRKTIRGTGGHMPFELFEALVNQVRDPRRFLLNYSGESTVYPHLIPAIRLARSTGAFVELVSAFSSAPESLVDELARSGLSRLTVSIHAADETRYSEIYRFGSLETLRARLARFLSAGRGLRSPPLVDVAFVAMDRNLDQLEGVASLAFELGIRSISIFPVIRRDEIPVRFEGELGRCGAYRGDFRERLQSRLQAARHSNPEIAFTVCNPSMEVGDFCLGEVPGPYPGPLPRGAKIHTCEQNPWETVHVLSNGDVVACEVLDKTSLGNLARETLEQIWQGEAYRQFRERYYEGGLAECSTCPWKEAYQPRQMESAIVASRGRSAQLGYGWHQPESERHVWSSQQAVAVLAPVEGSRAVHVSGILPPGPDGAPNELAVSVNGAETGRVVNPWREPMPFGMDFPAAGSASGPRLIQFRTRHVYRPSERSVGADQRDLGFAMVLVASKEYRDFEQARQRRKRLRALSAAIRVSDTAGRLAARFTRRTQGAAGRIAPGISILIPERDNPEELASCLASVREATQRWTEPIEVIVVVNGSPAADYETLRRAHADVRWQFHERALGFSGAIRSGLSWVHHDSVYLLNSDAMLDAGALAAAAQERDAMTFAVGSQIVLKDETRFRDETNWTTLLVEDGLATIHDRIPESGRTVESFYAGGGASLFLTRLLRLFLDAPVYDPFYWEDVEWGWRARKMGYRCVFCAASVVHHARRSTIGRHYSAAEIETVLCRNRLLFQLRNFTQAGQLERVMEEIAHSNVSVVQHFLRRGTLLQVIRGRIWNHLAPLEDLTVLAAASRASGAVDRPV